MSLAILLLILGIAGPQWGQDWNQTVDPGRDLIVVLDLSRSMLAENPSRLQQAKQALMELAHTAEARGRHRLALVIFAVKARVACHLTYDYKHFREVVNSYDANHLNRHLWPEEEVTFSGTYLDQGINEAMKLIDEKYPTAHDILLISDGGSTDDREWEDSLLKLKDPQKLVKIHCVGVGDPDRDHQIELIVRGEKKIVKDERNEPALTRLHEGALREIARRTRGEYQRLTLREPSLKRLFLQHVDPGPRRGSKGETLPVYVPRYPYFLIPALALFLGALVLGEGRR